MRRLWLWVALGLGLLRGPRARRHQVFEPVRYPSIRNQSFIKACLDAHNQHRAKVTPPASNMLYMTWDLALAKTARAWGKKCIYQHNTFRKLKGGSHPDPKFNPPGENLWIGNAFRRPFDPTNPVRTWYSEVVYYNYQNNSCTRICGHYTQIVWDTSYKLGCAIVYCRKLGNHRNIEKLVCNYGPAGNYPRRPYKTGQPCSACPKGDTCENKLCRNPARDHDNSKQDQQFIQNCVKIHNDFRSKVSPPASNMLHMTWDPALAKTAKAWAKRCIFDHNIYLRSPGKVHPEFTPVGENIWTGSLHLFSVEAAIRNWYNEVKDYDFESRRCAKACGHYTQVVWATSYKVGCAVQFCQRVSGFQHLSNGAHFVCNYGKAGNYPVHPYKRGRACSECTGDPCVQNLCENPERDQLKSYSHWYPDWDVPKHGTKSPPKTHPHAPDPTRRGKPQKPPHASTRAPGTSASSHSACDSYCIAVVILRMAFILLAFGTVAMLSKRYPEMFIYEKSLNL